MAMALQILWTLGGRGRVEQLLRGRGRGRSALERLAAVEQGHMQDAARPPYLSRLSSNKEGV
jgi:hypothetical protein